MPASCMRCTKVLTSPMPALAQVLRVRGEEADRVVAPVVAQPALDQVAVVDEGVHRQQLDRGDAELAQIVDHRGARQAAEGAARSLGHLGMAHREALDVHLVDDRLVPGPLGGPVAPQVKAGSITWHLGMNGALSRSSNDRSALGSPTR